MHEITGEIIIYSKYRLECLLCKFLLSEYLVYEHRSTLMKFTIFYFFYYTEIHLLFEKHSVIPTKLHSLNMFTQERLYLNEFTLTAHLSTLKYIHICGTFLSLFLNFSDILS